MEIKSRYWSDAQSCNEIKIEKQQSKKFVKITQDDDWANCLIVNSRKTAVEICKDCNEIKGRDVCVYENDSNLFDFMSMKTNNDSNLFDCMPMKTNMKNLKNSVEEQRRKQRERMEDIEIAKRWRKEREVEKAKLKELVARERALAMFEDDEFYFEQIKARAEIRFCEGRIKPIDILSMHLDEPCLVFESLEVKGLEDLCEDIKVYLDLDRATPTRICYWEAVWVVCDWELAKARRKEALDQARLRGEVSPAEFLDKEKGLYSSTEEDVKILLKGDSYSKIEEMQSEIESQMHSGSTDVVEYWEPILKYIRIYKAKAFLKEEFCARNLSRNLEKDHRGIRGQEVDSDDYGNQNADNCEKQKQSVSCDNCGSYLMETKCRYCCPQSSNENQQSKKRKINEDDMSWNTNSILPLNIMYSQRQTKEVTRPTNKKNSQLPLNVMFSVIEDKRREIQRNREVEKVTRQAEKMINKAQPEGRKVFFSCRMQPPAEFLDDERDLNSSTIEKLKYVLQGKSLSQLELIQSQIMSQWHFASIANSLEYWEMVLELIHKYKVKNLKKDRAGYGMEEGTGDNFEMMNMTSLSL